MSMSCHSFAHTLTYKAEQQPLLYLRVKLWLPHWTPNGHLGQRVDDCRPCRCHQLAGSRQIRLWFTYVSHLAMPPTPQPCPLPMLGYSLRNPNEILKWNHKLLTQKHRTSNKHSCAAQSASLCAVCVCIVSSALGPRLIVRVGRIKPSSRLDWLQLPNPPPPHTHTQQRFAFRNMPKCATSICLPVSLSVSLTPLSP